MNTNEPTFRFVSVRQEAAEKACAAGRTPCAEKTHAADCPGDCTSASRTRSWVAARLNGVGLAVSVWDHENLRSLFVAAVVGNDREMLRDTIAAFDTLGEAVPADLRAAADKALAA